jgi:hypothetical protein
MLWIRQQRRTPPPQYGTAAWRAYQYKQGKVANRGHNYQYWNEETHGKMLENGWIIYAFPEKNGCKVESTPSEAIAKEIVEKLRSEGNFARIVAGYDKNVQLIKRFSIIYKPKKK